MAATICAALCTCPKRTDWEPMSLINCRSESNSCKTAAFNCSFARATSPLDTDPCFNALTAASTAYKKYKTN